MKRNKIAISGVNINLDADDLKKVKSVKALSKLNIFSHIEDTEARTRAENELAVKLGITKEEEKTAEQQ